jgi:hypothetical protein
MSSASIVMTTIRAADTIADYARDLDRSALAGEVIVVGDRRGDREVGDRVARLRSEGLPVRYIGVAEQLTLLRRASRLRPYLRWNSIQRRNLGFLAAAELGRDFVVSVDDDNIPDVGKYVDQHAVVGTSGTFKAVRSPTGWFNVCRWLSNEPDVTIRHRGFPLGRPDGAPGDPDTATGRIVVNAGLWTGDPDIDAVTRIALQPCTTAIAEPYGRDPTVLAHGTWCPFNSQNTAFARDVLPAVFLWTMGEAVQGIPVDRYDDIWMSYFARHLIDHFGDLVSYGPPVVHQARNDHRLLADLMGELPGMRLTDGLIDLLDSARVTSGNYPDAARELVGVLQDELVALPDEQAEQQQFWLHSLAALDGWLDAYAEFTR